MDSEKLKQFIIPIALIVLIFVGLGYTGSKIYENYQSYTAANEEVAQKTATVQEKQAKLDEYKRKEQEEKAKENESKNSEKPFYKPVMSGLDTEAVIAGEFAEVLQLVRANQIKVRSIKYDYDPKDDAFV